MKLLFDYGENTDSCDVLFLKETASPFAFVPEAYKGVAAVITPLYEEDGYLCMSAMVNGQIYTQRSLTGAMGTARRGDTELVSFFIGDTLCAMIADTDAYHPEIFRALTLLGVKLLFCRRRIEPGEAAEDLLMFGPWANAQANNLFVVDMCSNTVNIICQCELSPDRSGFLRRNRQDSFSAALPVERFYEGQRSFPVFQSLNRELYRRYFGEVGS